MIRLLDDVFILKEIDKVDLPYSSEFIRNKYPDKIIVMRHVAFVYKDVLCEEAQKKLTDLSNYVLLGELANHICVSKRFLLRRIFFMQKSKIKLFDYIDLFGNYYIKLCDVKKKLFQEYQPFLIQLNDPCYVKNHTMLGDIAIGFY